MCTQKGRCFDNHRYPFKKHILHNLCTPHGGPIRYFCISTLQIFLDNWLDFHQKQTAAADQWSAAEINRN